MANSWLVGRHAELSLLSRTLDRLVDGNGGLVWIEGEPGIGKTRLAAEVDRLARGRGLKTAWTWINNEPPPSAVEVFSPLLGPQASLSIPITTPQEYPANRSSIIAAIVRAMFAAAAEAPLVAIIDDLGRADTLTLEAVDALASTATTRPLLLIVTVRSGSIASGQPNMDLAASILTKSMHLCLGGLSKGEVGQFAEKLRGKHTDSTTRDALYQRSEGNPFYLSQLIPLLPPQTEPQQGTPLDLTTVPVGIRQALKARLSQLPEGELEALLACAVAGETFEEAVARAILRQSQNNYTDSEISHFLDRLDARHYLQAPAFAQTRWSFCHSLLWQTVYEDIEAGQCRHMHRIASQETVAGTHRSEHGSADHVRHVLRAVPLIAVAKAAKTALEEAGRARLILAWERARSYCRQALDLIKLHPDQDDQEDTLLQHCLLLAELAKSERALGNVDSARRLATEAIDAARSASHPRVLANLALTMVPHHHHEGMPDYNARVVLEEVLDRLDDSEVKLKVMSLIQLASINLLEGASELAQQQTGRAVELARNSGDENLKSEADHWAHLSRSVSPDSSIQAQETPTPAQTPATEADDKDSVEIFKLMEDYNQAMGQARPRDGVKAVEALAALAVKGNAQASMMEWRLRAAEALRLGHLDEAEISARRAYAKGKNLNPQTAEATLALQLAGIRFEQRRGQEAQAILYGSMLQYLPEPAIDAVIAHIDAETGNLDKARNRFEDLARDGFSSIPSGYAGPAFLQFAARACFELGDRERAGQLRTMLASFVNNPVVLPVVGFVV
ncbi:MAG: AAA family ATPase [Deltaproteobacteria bacterium]